MVKKWFLKKITIIFLGQNIEKAYLCSENNEISDNMYTLSNYFNGFYYWFYFGKTK